MSLILSFLRDLWTLVGLGILAAMLAEFGLRLWHRRRRRPDPRAACDGYADRDWLAAHLAECDSLAFDWRPYVGYGHRPHIGRTLTIEADSRRRTWKPERRPDAPLRIWVFGGSTIFGVGSRDDATIPSALAKALVARGVAADVENRGVVSYVLAQEAIAFCEALRRGDRPDIAIFFDGVNDVICAAQSGRAGWPYRADKRAAEFMLLNRPRDLAWAAAAASFPRLGKRLAFGAGTPAAHHLASGIADEILELYAGGVRQLKAVAAAHDVTPFFIWQPTVYGKLRKSAYEARIGAEFAAESRSLFDEVYDRRRSHAQLAALPEALNLSDMFGDRPETLFLDPFHLTEDGNAVVAEALVPHVLAARPTGAYGT